MVLKIFKTSRKIFFIIGLCAIALLSCQKIPENPVIENGLLDIRHWDFEKDGAIKLRGGWKFKWMHDSLAFKEIGYNDEYWGVIDVPSSWKEVTGKGHGYGCYRLKVVADSNEQLVLYADRAISAYTIFVNGKQFIYNGNFGTNRNSSDPREKIIYKALPHADTICIAWYVSNFHDRFGGIITAPEIGKEDKIKHQTIMSMLINSIILGILLIISLYHLVIWNGRKNDLSNLLFSICCLVVFVRLLGTNNYLDVIVPDSNFFMLNTRLEYLTFALGSIFFPAFFRELFIREFSKKILYFFIITGTILFLLALFSKVWVYTGLVTLYQINILLVCGWTFWGIISAFLNKRKGALIIFIGALVLIVTVINDVLYANSIIGTFFMAHIGLVVFIIFQSLVLSRNIAIAFETSEHLTENLQVEVQKQTYSINEQKEALEKAYTKIKKLDQHKTMFYQNITHEFRTPLTLILNPLESALNEEYGELTKSLKKELKRVSRNADKLLNLINQLLDLARLEAGKMDLTLSCRDIIELIKVSISSFETLAKKQHKQIIFNHDKNSLRIEIDYKKIEHVIHNLLSNALKFTRKEENIIVECHLCDKDNKPASELVITIKDSGIGIPEMDIPLIFDRFYQVDNDITRSGKGTGIGLALVKEYIKLHEGEITVKSEENKYTEFKIKLPYCDIQEDTEDEKKSVNNIIDSNVDSEKKSPLKEPVIQHADNILDDNYCEQGKKILVVEDHLDMQNYIKSIFEKTFVMYTADNGLQGFELAKNEIPDLIISDIMMEESDGIEMLKKLKTDHRTNHIPVILLTGRANIEDKIDGIEKGAEDYIPKPFSKELLVTKVNTIFTQRKILQEKYMNSIMLEPENIVIPSAHESFVNLAIETVEKNLNSPDFSISMLSSEMGLSQIQLYRKFRSILGQSPGDFIMKVRLKRAAKMLEQEDSGLSISEIAYEVGFKVVSHFNKRFKEQYKLSPSGYKKKFT